jgi:hypothetical protein
LWGRTDEQEKEKIIVGGIKSMMKGNEKKQLRGKKRRKKES